MNDDDRSLDERGLPSPSRRRLFGAAAAVTGSLAAWPTLTLAGAASAGANRLVLVILRGGLDGLGAAPAPGDADFAAARGPLGQYPTPPLRVDATFSLHPSLVELHAMVGQREAAIVHAVGLPYRERSHFDAQQVLESGGTRPYELSTGWLGRALVASGSKGLALNTTVPLVLRSRADVDTWAPSALPDPSADLVARLERMYAGDPALATALERARQRVPLDVEAPRRHGTLGAQDHVFLREGERCWFVSIAEIRRLVVDGNYTRLWFRDQNALLARSLSALPTTLTEESAMASAAICGESISPKLG